MLNYFPKFFTEKAIYIYFASLLACIVIFFKHTMGWYFYLFGIAEVFLFFHFANVLTKKWSGYSDKFFSKKLFNTALVIRICYVIFSYFFYKIVTGQPFEFISMDAIGYHGTALGIVQNGFTHELKYIDSSDQGYPAYLGFIYKYLGFVKLDETGVLSGSYGHTVMIARLIKALLGAYTVLLMYRLGSRTFGENAGRIGAILCMIFPNLIFYCGLHVKEVEMLFIAVFFLERVDAMLRLGKYTVMTIAPPVLAIIAMFFLRVPLGAVLLLSVITAILFSSKRVVNWKQKIIVGVWTLAVLAYFIGGKVMMDVEQTWEGRNDAQTSSMQWRAIRKGGNKFVKNLSGAVFAPMIFAIPFPTVINTPSQDNQRLIHGGNFDKNIMAFFTMFSLFMIIKRKEWRKYILVGSYMIGYLMVIAFSPFAQSERFHYPALPFILMFAAYGISLCTDKTKKYFNIYSILMIFIVIGWSWFKLAGRGMA
ncbi:MAG: hypothetical protein LBN95_04510 [Prevotellaceae bacterium]|nr:hypothetical protein [Prevotellaceae bacterium]